MCRPISITGKRKAFRRQKLVGGLLISFFAFEAHAGIMVDRSLKNLATFDDSVVDVSLETTAAASSTGVTAVNFAAWLRRDIAVQGNRR